MNNSSVFGSTIRKAIAVFLTTLMILSILPMSVFAEEIRNAPARTEQPAETEAPVLTGKLLRAEVAFGDTRRVYAPDENGDIILVSEETVSRRGLFRAPARTDDSPRFDADTVAAAAAEAAAHWALTHAANESTVLLDGSGVAQTVYGAQGCDAAFNDADYDLICDDCGYCIDGCKDGVERYYREADVASSASGVYFNANGDVIGHDAVGTYTYEQVDEEGNVMLDDHGDPFTVTEEYDFIQFERYVDGADGVCDDCGNPVCRKDETVVGHDFGDGLCDACGACLGEHVDAAGAFEEDGVTPAPDGRCDLCGFCAGDCADDDEDGVCDVCGKQMIAFCDHLDLVGSAACGVCAAAPCHLTTARLQQILTTLTLIQSVLLKNDSEDASFHAWLNDTFTPFVTAAEEGGNETGLGSMVSMRQEMKAARQYNAEVDMLLESLRALDPDEESGATLAGYIVHDENGNPSLIDDSSWYGALNRLEAKYGESYEACHYDAAKSYYIYLPADHHTSDVFNACYRALCDAGKVILDRQIFEVYGSRMPHRIEVTESNYNEVRQKLDIISEALLYMTTEGRYTWRYDLWAQQLWDGGNINLSGEAVHCVGFLLLEKIEAELKKLKEMPFTQYQQTHLDTDGVYATRPAYEEDLIRDPDAPDGVYQVTDTRIEQMIGDTDSFLGSAEGFALLKTLLPSTFDADGVTDVNGDGKVAIYDFLMHFLTSKVINNDIVNQLFGMIYPMLGNLGAALEDVLDSAAGDYLRNEGKHKYSVDVLGILMGSYGGSEALNILNVGGTATLWFNGGKGKTLKSVLTKAGFSFWPSQIASLLREVNSSGKYTQIINRLNAADDKWENLLTDGKLDFDWQIETMDDFKNILTVLLTSIKPLTEWMFARRIRSNNEPKLDDVVYMTLIVNALVISVPLSGYLDFELTMNEMHLYDDVLLPIYEALGIDSFTPADGSYAPQYRLQSFNFEYGYTTEQNVSRLVDAIVDPLSTLLEQFATHPLEKLLSILPNLTLYLENGKLLELLDFKLKVPTGLYIDFNIGNVFSNLGAIIEDEIMDDWWDWINPLKYQELVQTLFLYGIFEEIFDAAMNGNWMEEMADFGVLGAMNSVLPTITSLSPLQDILNSLAGLCGGYLATNGETYHVSDDDVKLKIKIGDMIEKGEFGFYDAIVKTYLDEDVIRDSIGFDISRPSTIITWFFNRLMKSDNSHIHLVDTDLFDFDELSTLGEISVKDSAGRVKYYHERWTSLDAGKYYYVDADIADVYFHFVKLLSGVLRDKTAMQTILDIIGMDYDDLAATLEKLGEKAESTLGVTTAGLLKNATRDGKLDLDTLLSNMTAENLLLVLSEVTEPRNTYIPDNIEYPQTPAATAQEIEQHDGVIPYLSYTNLWSKPVASFAANDLDDLVDVLLQTVPIDLNADKEGIQTLREFIEDMMNGILHEPQYITMITELLTSLYSDGMETTAALIDRSTGIDISVWYNDFAYLFDDGAPAPTEKRFPLLTAVKGADGEVAWTYDGAEVKTYSDIFAALGYLLTPAQPVLDMMFCGKDFKILPYEKRMQQGDPEEASVITIPGHDGYNFCIIPLMESLSVDGILTSEEFRRMGTAEGLLYCVNRIVEHMYEILDSDKLLAELFETLLHFAYTTSGNGVDVLIRNLAYPVLSLLDAIRPVLNIDLNELINSLLCRYTYQIGGYASANDMMLNLKGQGAAINLRTMDTEAVLRLIGVIFSAETDGTRKYLDLSSVYRAGINDLAYLWDIYPSESYSLDESGHECARDAYCLNIDGDDALTAVLSMLIETMMTENNADVFDAFMEKLTGKKGVVKTALELIGGIEAQYTVDYDWAYILGEDAAPEQKAQFLQNVKNSGSVKAADYRTAQAAEDFGKYSATFGVTKYDERTAEFFAQRFDDVAASVFSLKVFSDRTLGDYILGERGGNTYTAGSFVSALVTGLLDDESIDGIVGLIGDLLNGVESEAVRALASALNADDPDQAVAALREISGELAKYNEAMCRSGKYVGLDLKQYNVDVSKTVYADGVVTYYDKNGQPTGLTRHTMAPDLSNLDEVICELLAPIEALMRCLLLGKDLSLFCSSGVPESRERRDDLIKIVGVEGYRYVFQPLFEAIGCKGLKNASDYGDDVNALLRDMFGSLKDRILELINGGEDGRVIDGVLEMLPGLLYFINSNGLGVIIENLTGPVTAVLDLYNGFAGKTGEDALSIPSLVRSLTGQDFDIFDLSPMDALSLVPVVTEGDSAHLHFSEYLVRLLENYTIGEIRYNNASTCGYDTYTMALADSRDKIDSVMMLFGAALDVIEDPENKTFMKNLFGSSVYNAICNFLNAEAFDFDYQEPTWLYTDSANSNRIVTALNMSKLFPVGPYAGKVWTREKAAELADNLDEFVADMIYLLGPEFNGLPIQNLRELMHALVGGAVFTNDVLNGVAGLLGDVAALVQKYDQNGAPAGFVRNIVDLDVHAWDDYAPGGKYENGRDWGFLEGSDEATVDANAAIFEAGLVELLSPASAFFAWLLANEDFETCAEADGLGDNTGPIQITFPGAEGYKYGLIPLFEALNIDGSPKDLVRNLRDGSILPPDEFTARVREDVTFAVTGVVHPLVVWLQKAMDSTATQLFELLPSLVYFINSGGLDTVVKNVTHAVLVVMNAAEPLKSHVDEHVYDENGNFELWATLDFGSIIKNDVFGMLGVTEDEVRAVYAQSGGVLDRVDGLEDVDMRLIYSIAVASLNGVLKKAGVPFRFTTIVGNAIDELTHGYVRSYDSLTGKTAYTMVLDKNLDRYCYGDMLCVLTRLILKFLAQDGNVDAVMGLLDSTFGLNEITFRATHAFLTLLATYMTTYGGYEVAMTAIYYTVYGAHKGAHEGRLAYDKVNDKLSSVSDKLRKIDDPIAREVLNLLLDIADENVGDVIGSDGLAANGLIRFFMKLYEILQKIIGFFKNLFG